MPRYPERLENIMTVHIHEVDRDPTTGQAISVALCGHDDEPDSDIPAGMARRVFVGFVDGHTAAVMVSQIKAFATSVGTWLGVTDVYLYVPPIRVEENAQNMEARPLVWAYTAPIS